MKARNGTYNFICTLILLWPTLVFANEGYVLGPGDIVKVTVYLQPDLATTARIDDEGEIFFPLLGEVSIGGISADAAAKHIAQLLRNKKFVKKPQVSLIVEKFQSQYVSVLGEVKKPGRYIIETTSRVIDALAEAGGVTDQAHDILTLVKKRENGKIYHIDLLNLYEGNLSNNYIIRGGDFISVPKMKVFYIYGEVKKSGSYRLERGMTVMQVLSIAGGFTDRASESGIRIKRKRSDGGVVSRKASLNDVVQANDVIYIKESLF